MSECMLQVQVHIYGQGTIYCNKVIGLTAYYWGCTSYVHLYYCDTRYNVDLVLDIESNNEWLAFSQQVYYVIIEMSNRNPRVKNKQPIWHGCPGIFYFC